MAVQKVIITTRLLLEKEGFYLYLEQTEGNGGAFTLPGGKVEQEEFAKQALVRESYEEVGITLKKKSLDLVHAVYKKLKNSTEIIFFFKAVKWKGELKNKEPLKFVDFAWFPVDDIPIKTPRILKYALGRIQEGKMYSEYPKETKSTIAEGGQGKSKVSVKSKVVGKKVVGKKAVRQKSVDLKSVKKKYGDVSLRSGKMQKAKDKT